MYYKLNEDELERMFRASKITMTDYELIGNFAPVENLMTAIEDLLIELDKAEEKYNDLEEQLRENYKPINYAEEIGYNEREFYEEEI